MKLKSKFMSFVTSAVCALSAVSVMPVGVSAAEEGTYGVLSYEKTDENSDGTYDYITITGCDETATDVEVPSEIDGLPVTTIGELAFFKCTSLKNVDMPATLIQIDECAFEFCSSLEKVEIPKSVKEIKMGAFHDCASLKSITVNNSDCNLYDDASVISNSSEYDLETREIYSFFDGTIHGYINSTAQAYAEKYGYNFMALDENITISKGDVNRNGTINLYDVIEVAKYILNMTVLDSEQLSLGDMNSDGVVNLYDAIEIAKIIMG